MTPIYYPPRPKRTELLSIICTSSTKFLFKSLKLEIGMDGEPHENVLLELIKNYPSQRKFK